MHLKAELCFTFRMMLSKNLPNYWEKLCKKNAIMEKLEQAHAACLSLSAQLHHAQIATV